MKSVFLFLALSFAPSVLASPVVVDTGTTTGASAVSSSLAVAGPGDSVAVSIVASKQHATAEATSSASKTSDSVSSGISGSTSAGGEVTAQSYSTGSAAATSYASGESLSTANALAAAALCGCHPVKSEVQGNAVSRNSNSAATFSSNEGGASAYEGSFNNSYFNGFASASRADGDTVSTSSTTLSQSGILGSTLVRSGSGTGFVSVFTNSGSASVFSQSQAGGVNTESSQ